MLDVVWIALSALAIAAACGLRAFLPLLFLALGSRIGITELKPGMEWLQSNFALWALGLATLVEVAGDKIPVVDHVLDAVGLALRPVAAGFAVYAMTSGWPPAAAWTAVVLAALLTLAVQLTKAHLRLGSTALTGGLGNPLLSLLEDLLSLAGMLIAALAPVLMLVVLIGLFWWIERRTRTPAAQP